MATLYEDVYGSFSGKTSDYLFLQIPISDQDEILFGWMKSAISKYKNCKKDLTDRDEVLKKFNVDLDDEEIDILSGLMIVEWLNPKLYTVEILQNNLSSKDFNMYSPANLLKEIRSTHDKAKADIRKQIISYSYNGGGFNLL